jgi:dephospho-CoA kinase
MDLHQQLVNDPKFKEAFKGVPIYGVAGSNGSGKDTVLQVFADSGFFVFNTGDALRQITTAVMGTTQRGGNDSPTGRIANAQRAIYPGGMVTLGMIDYWARVLHMPTELRPKGLAIGSIRSVSEVQTLKDFGGKLIVVDADPKVRYDRVVVRGRAYEKEISFEQFIAEDEAEMGKNETDPTKFGLAQVLQMGDIRLDNSSSSIDEFMQNAKQQLGLASHG